MDTMSIVDIIKRYSFFLQEHDALTLDNFVKFSETILRRNINDEEKLEAQAAIEREKGTYAIQSAFDEMVKNCRKQ